MQKRSELITVILFCLIIAVLSVSFVIIPDRAFSDQEKRALAQFPDVNADAFFSGEFAENINIYFAEQFPFRDTLVKLKSASELLFLKGENNSVLYSNGQLALKNFDAYKSITEITENTDRFYPEKVKAQLASIETLGNTLNVPLLTVLPPRTIDIADSIFDYDRPDGDLIFDLMDEALKDKSGYIDTLSDLRSRYENGEYVYYRTDHHWTTLGAYYTYCEIMRSLGKEDRIIPKEEFEIEQIGGFSGSTAAKANFPIYEEDIIELWHLPDDGEYEVVADGEALGGLYDRSYLETGDKYSVFLGGTHNLTIITKPGEERETLLVAKDSFADCLIPFLAREYNIVAVNLNNVSAISAAAENYDADAVLIVYNTENIISTGAIGKIQ